MYEDIWCHPNVRRGAAIEKRPARAVHCLSMRGSGRGEADWVIIGETGGKAKVTASKANVVSDTVEISIAELEVRYRANWSGFTPSRIREYLDRAPVDRRLEALVRLLAAELEFAYLPPSECADTSRDEGRLQRGAEDDEERVRPTLQLFVLQFPELANDSEAIIRLAVLEYALRLRFDRLPPNPDSYLPLCPHEAERLHQLLRLADRRLPPVRGDEPLAEPVAKDESTVRDHNVSESLASLSLPAYLNCFLLLRRLGRGGMGYVYGAIDLRSAAQVAVKVMRRTDAWSAYRFMEEFSWLSRLEHPNLVQLHDAFHEDQLRYFSMELVEGKPIRRWFQSVRMRHPERAWEHLQRVLAQIASAIAYLHSQGVVHCDIKCSNVLITSRMRAVLLDMGLAMRLGRNQTFMGTLQYMAPELIAGGCPTQASDWYSFGMLLYEVISDNYPPIEVRQAESPEPQYSIDQGLLRARLMQADCSPWLADLCCQLLATDPLQRPDGNTVLQQLGSSTQSNDQTSGAASFFVGREDELARMQRAVQEVTSSGPRLLLVEGAAGIGKTSLLEQFLRSISETKSRTVFVRCLRQDHTPLRLAHAIVLEICELNHQRQELAEADLVLTQELTDLHRVFPQVRQLNESEESTAQRRPANRISSQVQRHALQQLRVWLSHLSTTRPIVLVIDDAHFGDRESLECLAALAHEPAFLGAVVLAFDTAGSEVLESLLQKLPGQDKTIRLPLTPLSLAECRELVNRWTDGSTLSCSDGQIDEIARRCGGNPFLLKEYLRELAVSNRKNAEGIADELRERTSSQDVTAEPERGLSIQAENVLQYLAVLDEPITFHQLQMVSRIVPHELQNAVNQLISSGWIRTRLGSWDSHITLAHDAFRAPILDRMPEARRRRRHFRVARMLSSQVPTPWARMGLHYWESGNYREAAACYLQAALQARAEGNHAQAIELLKRAEHPEAVRSHAEQLQVMVVKAECLQYVGAAGPSARAYDLAASFCTDETQCDLYRALAGEQWIREGELERGLDRLRSVAGIDAESTFALGSRFSQSVIRFRTLAMAVRHRKGWPEVPEVRREFSDKERCLARLPLPTTFLDSRLGPTLLLELSRLSRRCGSEGDRSLVLLHASLLLTLAGRPWHRIAIRWYRQARELSHAELTPQLAAQTHLTRAIWHILRGRFRGATKAAGRAMDHFEDDPLSVQWELLFARWLRVAGLWHQGALQELRADLDAFRTLAMRQESRVAELLGLVGPPFWSDLFFGEREQIDSALEHATELIAAPAFQSPRFFWWISSIYRALYLGLPEQAYELLHRYWPQMHSQFLLTSPHYRWLAVSAGLSCNLVLLRQEAHPSRKRLREIRRWMHRLRRLREPALAGSGEAFELALRVHCGQPVGPDEFSAVADRLERAHHGLMAAAVRVLAGASDGQLHQRGMAFFQEQGCRDINRVLDFILPLPEPVAWDLQPTGDAN
ncbi:MAG: hypothetical protein D6753_09855 [Planctomycetota bacterium]|nr:MAG: hypothetical protein D6753_09855 [Planctomycetota bacterium]